MAGEIERIPQAETNQPHPYLPAREQIFPDLGPTPIEQSPSIYEEVSKELGFEENERLRMIRVRFTNLLRTIPEPEHPKDQDEDFDYPEEVITLIREYQSTAEDMLDETPNQESRLYDRKKIGLDITYAGMFQAGGWTEMAHRRVYTAHQYAREMDDQFPDIFAKITEVTKEPGAKIKTE